MQYNTTALMNNLKSLRSLLFEDKFRVVSIVLYTLIYAYTFFSESIPVNNGKGWDGGFNYSIAENGINIISYKLLNWYRALRIFPFIIADILFIKNYIDIILFFKLFNILIISASIIYFFKICHIRKLETDNATLLFILFFFSFPVLKLINYYPLLTDYFSLFLSFAGLYFFLNQNRIKLLTVIILSFFTFPSLTFAFLLITIFSKENWGYQVRIPLKLKWLSVLVFIPFVLSVYVIAKYYNLIINYEYKPLNGGSYVNLDLLVVSIVSLFLYLLIIAIISGRSLNKIKINFIGLDISYTILGAALFVTGVIIYYVFPGSPKTAGDTVFIYAINMPFVFLVAHTFYFGLLFLIGLLHLPKMLSSAFDLSLGFLLLIIGVFFFMVSSESRVLINMIPFVLVVLMPVWNTYSFNKFHKIFILLVCCIQSRFFISINQDNDELTSKILSTASEFMKYPAQRYFMNSGPWISFESYYYEFIFAIILFIIACYLLFSATNRNPGFEQ